jgi:hypothetical protein
MTTPSTCPLCANVATVEAREGGWRVACPRCLRFTLDPYLMDLFHQTKPCFMPPRRVRQSIFRPLGT